VRRGRETFYEKEDLKLTGKRNDANLIIGAFSGEGID